MFLIMATNMNFIIIINFCDFVKFTLLLCVVRSLVKCIETPNAVM